MHATATLRKVGGSVMLTIPAPVLNALGLVAGATLDMEIDQNRRLVVNPKPRLRYTLDELLAQCDPCAEMTDEDRQWLNSRPVGRELI